MAQVVFAALLTALSAVLLMSVQPLATKDCLPLLGGTPAVWAITLVFFQITLLLGYATAIPLARMGTLARCLILTPTLALALCFLPPHIDPEALAAAMGESWPWWPLLMALARGFFFAGSKSLLVTHWSVESESAMRLTTKTFSSYQQDPQMRRSEALRQAMLTTMATPKFSHPTYWAPYALVGEGGR